MKLSLKSIDGIFGAWLVALVATLAALFIGEVMGQAPCELCWYQRIAMFPLVLILGSASFRGDANIVYHALPLALAGGLVAGWHSLLYAGLVPEPVQPCSLSGPSCTGDNQTIFGNISLPYMSLLAFTLIAGLLLLTMKRITR